MNLSALYHTRFAMLRRPAALERKIHYKALFSSVRVVIILGILVAEEIITILIIKILRISEIINLDLRSVVGVIKNECLRIIPHIPYLGHFTIDAARGENTLAVLYENLQIRRVYITIDHLRVMVHSITRCTERCFGDHRFRHPHIG